MPKIMQKVRMIETNEFEINCNKENVNYTHLKEGACHNAVGI